MPARTRVVGGVIGPSLGVDTPALSVALALERVVECESTDEDDLPASFAEGRDARRRKPVTDISGIVIPETATELGVGVLTGPFTLDGHDDRLRRIAVEEGDDLVHQIPEVLEAGERDGGR